VMIGRNMHDFDLYMDACFTAHDHTDVLYLGAVNLNIGIGHNIY
jgi:hypothetical protein